MTSRACAYVGLTVKLRREGPTRSLVTGRIREARAELKRKGAEPLVACSAGLGIHGSEGVTRSTSFRMNGQSTCSTPDEAHTHPPVPPDWHRRSRLERWLCPVRSSAPSPRTAEVRRDWFPALGSKRNPPRTRGRRSLAEFREDLRCRAASRSGEGSSRGRPTRTLTHRTGERPGIHERCRSPHSSRA